MTELTKAEQLEKNLENPESMTHARIVMSEASAELRRISPMEAQLNDERELVNRGTALLLNITDRCDSAYLAKSNTKAALKNLLERYTSLVNCGDCGNWNPEDEIEVIAARKALGETK